MIVPTKANKTGFNKSTLLILVFSLCSTMERELLMLIEISAEIIVLKRYRCTRWQNWFLRRHKFLYVKIQEQQHEPSIKLTQLLTSSLINVM